MAKIKDAAELLTTTGLALSRYIKGLKKDISHLEVQKPTDRRIVTLKDKRAALEAASKKTSGKGKPKTGAQGTKQKVPASEIERKRARELKISKEKETMTERLESAKEKVLKSRGNRELKRLIGTKVKKAKEAAQNTGKISNIRTTDILTPEGEDLFNEGTKESLTKLVNNFKKYSYPGGRQKPRSKTGGPPREEPKDHRLLAEQIEEKLGQSSPSHTASQAAEELGLGPKGTSPTEAELRAMGGYEIFKKGGLKKYQSRVKYGGKEYAYMGGGMVGDIPHFKPKKKSRKK